MKFLKGGEFPKGGRKFRGGENPGTPESAGNCISEPQIFLKFSNSKFFPTETDLCRPNAFYNFLQMGFKATYSVNIGKDLFSEPNILYTM